MLPCLQAPADLCDDWLFIAYVLECWVVGMDCTSLMKIAKDISSVDLSAWEWRRPTPMQALFLQRLRHSTSDSPLHCWQPSIFCCWVLTLRCGTACMYRRYVGTVYSLWWPTALDSRRACSQNHILTFGWFVYSGPISVLNTYIGHSKNSWLIDW